LTDTAHATPGPLPPQPHRSHGCLWGCLIAALVAIVAIVGAVSYTGWYLYTGFKNDPTLHAVIGVVNNEGVARAVLGNNITITNVEGSSFNTDLNTGKTVSYVAHLKGSKGEGTLNITVVTPKGGAAHTTVLMLTGPDGHKYDLLNTGEDSIAPAGNSTDTPQGQGNNP
jgi:hypothetical protein